MADAMKLLPCPMCGGEAALLDYEARYGGLHYASRCPQCASCGCSMGYLPTAKKAVEAWNCRTYMPAPEKTPSFDDARRKLIHCIEQWDGETEYDAEDIAALADDILDVFASPPAREEAPAEGAGEDLFGRLEEVVAFFEGHADILSSSRSKQHAQDIRAVLSSLRNRTSEPEAGAVAWRFPSALQPGLTMFTDAPPKDPNSAEPLYTHPAPATADKLKVAVEALERIRDGYDAKYTARQALAALNEEG